MGLAYNAGYPSLRQFLKEMDSQELTDWLAWEELGNPIETMWDYRFGVLACLIAKLVNCFGGGNIPINPSNYFVSLRNLSPINSIPQSPEEQVKIALAWAMASGATIIDPNKVN